MYSFPYLEPVCCSMSSCYCYFLTCIQISQETGKVIWYSHLFKNFPQFAVLHIVKGFSVVNEAVEDYFLESPCFLYDLIGVGNLISGSSAFYKSSLCIWKFSVHILLKPSLKDFKHNLTSMWNGHDCMVVWAFFGIVLLGIGMKTDIFQSCGHCRVFQICWHIECSTLTTSSFSIWYSTAGIPSLTLGLFVVILRPSWLHTPGYLALGEWPRHHGYLGH